MTATIEIPKLLVPVSDAAKAVGLSRRTVWRLVSAGEFPRPVKVSGRSLWRVADLERWSEALDPAA